MVSKDEKVYMEFIFARENSVNRQQKVKAFWKFLDAQDNLHPHKGITEDKSPPRKKSPVSSVQEILKEKDIWRKGLRVFRQLGLDKTALAADNRCRLCLVEKTIQCEDLADTLIQPYEELNADMKAFDQRQQSRSSNRAKGFHVSNASRKCSSNYVKMKK